jgi:nucleotide-binding universal stress UspA family protein
MVADVFGDDAGSVTTVLAVGRPVEEILRHARAYRADLLVVGTTGRTGVERLLLGSVAEKVVREGTIPVLTVP